MIQYKDKQVTVFESALFRTTSTVVETPDLVLVVDPNWLPQEVYAIRQYVATIRKGRALYLLFTHSDYDHILGYHAFPDAQVIAAQAFVDNKEKESAIEQILQFDHDYYIRRDYKIEYPQVDIVVKTDGQTFHHGETCLAFYLAPGHNRDGIFTLVEDHGTPNFGAVWIAGDYLCNVEFPYIYFSIKAYEETLGKTGHILSSHKVRLMIPGHGDVATSADEISARKQMALDYINQIRDHVFNKTPFDLDKLWAQYHFPKAMIKFHEANIEWVKKEVNML